MSDPEYDDREWYRHRTTGQRGFMVHEDGKPYIRLDRGPAVRVIEPYRESTWAPEEEPEHSASPAQMAHVLYQADLALCRAIGYHPALEKDRRLGWDGMSVAERMEWWRTPPKGRKIRVRAWHYLKRGLEGGDMTQEASAPAKKTSKKKASRG